MLKRSDRALDQGLHFVGGIPIHGFGDVGIDVVGEGCGGMAQVGGHLLQWHALLDRQRGKGMPLRYNYDKPEKPRISRVFGYQARFFILFQPEKSSREVVIS